MQVMEFEIKGNSHGICKYMNLTVKTGMSESLNKRCCTVSRYFFLSIHGSQQPRRGRPSNVFRTFGRS